MKPCSWWPSNRDVTTNIRLELPESLPSIKADRVQILQVLVNLIRNALDAMEQHIEEEQRMTISANRRAAWSRSPSPTTDPVCPAPTHRTFSIPL